MKGADSDHLSCSSEGSEEGERILLVATPRSQARALDSHSFHLRPLFAAAA